MHRELSHTDELFAPPRHLSLYLFTGLITGLLALDLWGLLAGWLASQGTTGLWRPPERLFGRETPFALLAAVLGTARVLYSALDALAEGRTGADLALAIAAFAAIVIGQPLVAAEVIVIGLIGETLEAITFARTQAAIGKLSELFPCRCWRLAPDGSEERVFTSDLQVGDRVRVKPGAIIPADGTVTEGRSAVVTSALTGESLPIDKGPGDDVLAGSVNQFGALTFTCERVHGQTIAGRVLEITARALREKAPIQRRADQLARLFLPVVLGLAALTFLAYFAWFAPRMALPVAAYRAVFPMLAVLVVACPCALILATPAAVMAALARLAGTGVLLKSGIALERLAAVRAIAFDKTGTLTAGRLELGDIVPLHGDSENELLALAAAVEQASEHPLARVICRTARERGLVPRTSSDFLAHPGAGVTARIDERTVIVGTLRLLQEQCITVPVEAIQAWERLDESGQTGLLVARDGVVIGVIGARDQIRPEADEVLRELRTLGLTDLAILSGDRSTVVRNVAGQLGVTQIHAGLLPAEKAEQLGEQTAFVGDGVNDAPALARASVGIAVAGTDLAAEAGDVVLMGEPLRPLPFLVRLSRATVAIIEQNILIFAFGLNAIGIVLTAWIWPLLGGSDRWHESAPLAAAIYHQLASLAVLFNAMRLLAFERPTTIALWGQLQAWGQRIDRGIDTLSNVDEWLHELVHHGRAVLAGSAALGLLVWLATGVIAVAPDEQVVVRRFGRPFSEPLGPGLHWRLPWPIERLDRVATERVRVVEVGFRTSAPRSVPSPSALTWASGHGDAIDRISDESEMMTGDGNLIELLASVRYRVSEPTRFLLEVNDPESVLRSAAESALREAIAGEPFLELLTARRPALATLTRAGLERRLATLGGLGIQLEGVSLHDLHPPAEVVRAFHDVARAMEERDRKINEAEADALRRVRSAAGEALHTARQGEANAARTLADATASRDGDRAWIEPRLSGSDTTRSLTEFRLGWEALERALAGRDKIVIDTDKLPGKRQLWMIDPELFRPPPVVTPGRPREEGP